MKRSTSCAAVTQPESVMAIVLPSSPSRGVRDILPLLDLQWFAAEDEGRTEDPTEFKIRKAREEGESRRARSSTARSFSCFPS
jgi:hypothetical protein